MRLWAIIVGCVFVASVSAQDRPVKKVLLIGIDGCRTDAMLAAEAPNLHRLAKSGAICERNDILGERKPVSDTVTMPGWTTMLTGVWGDKHGVRDNAFRKTALYATFFSRLRAAQPKTTTVALLSFRSLVDHVFASGDGARVVLDGSKNGFEKADALVTDTAVKLLADEDPTVLFVYFGQVDVAGHNHGFHPKVEKYVGAIAAVDRHVGRVLEAIERRPIRAKEDWLILIGTDHGGHGTGHTGGKAYEEVRYTFLILNGPSVEKGALKGTTNADVAVTALAHLGIEAQRERNLDGRVVGLRRGADGTP
jgi:predicted AlkP superfamily pyrophosphatase or phosphodiesterase